MTPQEFEDVLARHTWRLTDSGAIRLDNGSDAMCCPLRVAAGSASAPFEFDGLASALGIPVLAARFIVSAADNEPSKYHSRKRYKIVRKMLLAKCRLTEVKP